MTVPAAAGATEDRAETPAKAAGAAVDGVELAGSADNLV